MQQPLYKLLLLFCLLFSEILSAQSYKIELIKDINPSGNGIDLNYISERQSLVFKNKYYFTGVTPTERSELWVTDGTTDGTMMLKDIDSISSSNPRYFTEYNGKLYFSARKSGLGTELWSTDGTTDGTSIVADQSPGGASSTPTNIVVFKNKLWYTGIQVNNTPNELSYSDGTREGTKVFRSVDSTQSFLTNVSIRSVTDSMLYLTGNIKAEGAGIEFVRTDGTAVGTTIVRDLLEGIDSFDLVNFSIYNDGKKMLFFASTKTVNPQKDYGIELWKSDGTTLGTNLIKDFNPMGNGSSKGAGRHMYTYKGKTYFYAFNETVGLPFYNTWRTDGTQNGTEIFERDSGLISFGYTEFNNDCAVLKLLDSFRVKK